MVTLWGVGVILERTVADPPRLVKPGDRRRQHGPVLACRSERADQARWKEQQMKTIVSSLPGRVFGLAAVVALAACASTQVLTQGEVGRSGARNFNEPKATMFAICVGALTAEGYEITHSDLASGLIETKPLAVGTPGPVTARAYRVTVTSEGQGSRVVAQPVLFAGTRD